MLKTGLHQDFFCIHEICRRFLIQNQTYMKSKLLLILVMTLFITSVQAQKKQQKKVTGFAITSQEKGGRSWKEVRLVDINSGQELQSIYKSNAEITALNARTGKPVVKKSL